VKILSQTYRGMQILDSREKKLVGLALISGILLSFVEMFVISLIFPVLQMLSNGRNTNGLVNEFLKKFGVYSLEKQVIALFLFIFTAYLLRTCVYLIHKSILARVRKILFVRISTRLFGIYLQQDIEFHGKRNSSELIKNIYGVGTYLNNYVFGIVTLLAELLWA